MDEIQLTKYRNKKSVSESYKIPTKQLNLNVDYDLPYKQLQYTKTRKYKQNLNPIFEMLSTNNYRYDRSFANIPQKQYVITRNNIKPQCRKDTHQQIQENKKSSSMFDKKLQQNKNPAIFSFGDVVHSFSQQQKNREDMIETNKNKKYIDQDVKSKEKENFTLNLPLNKFINKKQQHLSPSQEKIISSQVAQEYLIHTVSEIKRIQTEVKESNEKLSMLREKVSMLKEKNLLKDRQIYFMNEQKQKLQKKQKALEKQLASHSQKYKSYETQHHEIYNKLKRSKQELKRQYLWLQEQKTGIQKIKQKLQSLLKKMKALEQEQDKREEHLKRVIEEQEINRQLESELDDVNVQVDGLRQQVKLVEQETETLQMHENQLINLQLKFKQQTQKLQKHLNQLQTQFEQRTNSILQEFEIDQMTKDLQLQIGQMSQEKIMLEQHIQQVHLKISMKNRNIRHIQQSVQERKYKAKSQQRSEESIYPSSLCRKPKEGKMNNLKDKIVKGDNNIFPLPTIRQQQSKDTSVYQTPRNQQLPVPQQQQSSYHPFSSNQLEIDSRMFSRTETNLQEYQQKQKKKYFVIESQEDAASNKKPIYCFKRNENYVVQNGERASIEQKIQRQQQRINNVNENQQMKTQNDDQYSSSIELSSQHNNQANPQSNKRPTSIEKYNHHNNKSIKPNKPKGKQTHQLSKSSNIMEHHSNDQSQEVFQQLIQQFQHIKSNSYFDECWKEKI